MAEYMKTDGTVEIIQVKNFAHAQKLVGGLVEIVHSYTGKGKILVNEEGMILSLPLNTTATVLAMQPLYGDVLRLSDAEYARIMR